MTLDDLSLIPLYIIPGYVAISIRRHVFPYAEPSDGLEATVRTLMATAVLVAVANFVLWLAQRIGDYTEAWSFQRPEEFFSPLAAFVATCLAIPGGVLWVGLTQWSGPLALLRWLGTKLGIQVPDHRDPLYGDDIWVTVHLDNGRILTGKIAMLSSHYYKSLHQRDIYLTDIMETLVLDDGRRLLVELDKTDNLLISGAHILSVSLEQRILKETGTDQQVEAIQQAAVASDRDEDTP